MLNGKSLSTSTRNRFEHFKELPVHELSWESQIVCGRCWSFLGYATRPIAWCMMDALTGKATGCIRCACAATHTQQVPWYGGYTLEQAQMRVIHFDHFHQHTSMYASDPEPLIRHQMQSH